MRLENIGLGHMDAEDRTRTISNKEKLRAMLFERRVLTNEQVRRVAGSRGMARAWELKQEYEAQEPQRHTVDIRKLKGGLWEVRLDMTPLGRDAMHRAQQKTLW